MNVALPIKGRRYEIHPGEMQRICDTFMESWTDELSDMLMTRETDDINVLQSQFCGANYEGNDGVEDSITRSCKGLDMGNLDPATAVDPNQ